MSKQWTLNGKSISDFKNEIDYKIDSLQDRLDLVKRVLGEQTILHNGEVVAYKYHDFFPEYFGSTPKFSMDRMNAFLEHINQKREKYKNDMIEYDNEILKYNDDIMTYKQEIKLYKKTLKNLGEQEMTTVYKPVSPNKPKKPKDVTKGEILKEREIKKLLYLLSKERSGSITKEEVDILRNMMSYWMYNGDRETEYAFNYNYDYSYLSNEIDELKQSLNLSQSQEKRLADLNDLSELVSKENLTKKEISKFKSLSRKYAVEVLNGEKIIDTRYATDSTLFPNYTPLAGTANEVNMEQVVSNLKPLSENDYVCKTLESIGSYLIRQAEKEEKMIAERNGEEYDNPIPTLDERDIRTNDQREKSIDEKRRESGEAPISKKNQIKLSNYEVRNIDRDFVIGNFEQGVHESKFPYFLIVDRSNSREEVENEMGKGLYRYGESLKTLRTIVETGQRIGSLERIDHKTRYKIQRWIGDIKANESELLKSQRRFIVFKKLEKGFHSITFEDNTGYIDLNDEYKQVSNNKFEFGKKEHIAGLIKVYPDIIDYEKRVETELYHVMLVFKRIIAIAKHFKTLESHELDILKWHMCKDYPITIKDEENKIKCKTIQGMLLNVHGLDWDDARISRTLKHTIPEKLVKVYKQWYEVWAYTYRIKGRFKKCTKCSKIKLAWNKYFTSDKKSPDGYGQCKVCKNKK